MIKQLKGEKVSKYAERVRRLIKKVDPTNAMQEWEKVYQFQKGLLPNIISDVVKANPATL